MTETFQNKRRIVAWFIVPALLVAAAGGWFALHSGFRGAASAAEPVSNMSKAEFEQRVHDYLLAHPEVVTEAIGRLEARQHEQEAAAAKVALKSRVDQVFNDPANPVGGNPKGDATLVEFFDYNCPYCKRMVSVMADAEKADPGLRVVYKEFPILGPNSLFAAKAALAADRQGKYVAFHRALFESHGPVDENRTLEAAKAVGLDMARLKADMQDPKINEQIEKNIELARALNINGTPGFAIGETVLVGATDLKSLQTVIASARRPPAAKQ